MKKFFVICLALAIGCAGAFDYSKWKSNGLDISEYKDGVLHLAQTSKAGKGGSLDYRFSKPEIRKLVGKQLVFSAAIEQLASQRAEAAGIVIYGRLKSGKSFSKSCYLPYAGKREPAQLMVYFDVPEDIYTLYARFDAPRKRMGTADVLFRDIKMVTKPAGTESWSCGTGTFFCVGKTPVFWRWKTTPGLKAVLKKDTFHLDGKGTLFIRCYDRKPYILNGSTPDFGRMTFRVSTTAPVTVDITSYNKKNQTVKLDKIAVSKSGRINPISIPLSRFAAFHDLVSLDEISFTVDGKQSIRAVCLADLNMSQESRNIMFDPSFEKSEKPESNYMLWGEYLSEKLADKVEFSTAEKFHGKRSVRIAPQGFITLQAVDSNGISAVFSLYAKGKGKFGVQLQQQSSKLHGPIAFYSWKKEFDAQDKWSRFEFVSPNKLKKFAGRQLYIVTIRNLSSSPLFIDAVQLEQNVVRAGVFKEVRSTAFSTWLNTVLPLEPVPEPEKLPANPSEGKVKVTAINPDARSYSSVPVRGAVTFGKGEFFDARCLELVDASGKRIPAQFTVLARRHVDKSIISVAVDFASPLKANERKEFFVRYGKTPVAQQGKNIAVRKGDDIVIDTGKLSLTLTPRGKSFISGCDAFCAVRDVDGSILRSKADIVRIEENGPERATVFLRGTAKLAWELRLTFFRNQPYMAVNYSFENNFKKGDNFSRTVRAIYVELPGGKAFSFDRFSGNGNALFVQRHTRSGLFKWNAYTRINGKTDSIDHLKLNGSGRAGKAAFSIMDFAELAPRAVEFCDGKVRLFHYPAEGAALLDMPLGFSSTMQFNYAFDSADVPASQNAILYTDPAHTLKSDVFDLHLSREEMFKLYPKTAADLEKLFDAVGKETTATAFYGFGDYGDWGSRNYAANHETTGVRSLWTRYLVSGEVSDFKNACAHAMHQRDVDQMHVRYGTSGCHTHHGFGHQSYSFHTGHFWLNGIVSHYLLTGDRRSYDASVSAMAALIEKAGLKYPRGRERHRMLIHLAEVYSFTGIPLIRKAFERQYNNGGESDGGGYYGALSYEALEKLYDATGDKKYLDRLSREVREFEKRNRVDFKPMPEDRGKQTTQGGTADSGRGIMSVYSGSRAALRYNDPALINYLNSGNSYDPVMNRQLDPRARMANQAWIYGVAAAMKHFGLKENAALPDSYHFIDRLVGLQRLFNNYVPFVFEAVPESDGCVRLDLYRYRMFRYWNKKLTGDYIYCKVFSSNGKLLLDTALNSNVTNEHKRVTVKSPDGKPLRVELVFDQDSWGSVSSPGKLRLSSKRTFGARNNALAVIYLKAPASGRLEFDWTWAWKNNISAGEIFSAYFETPDGKPVVRNVYVIPGDMPSGDVNKYTLKVDIPAQYRGKTLRLYLNAPKWMSFELRGLDYPWLGNRASDIE